jgi:hypothetical protein
LKVRSLSLYLSGSPEFAAALPLVHEEPMRVFPFTINYTYTNLDMILKGKSFLISDFNLNKTREEEVYRVYVSEITIREIENIDIIVVIAPLMYENKSGPTLLLSWYAFDIENNL